MKKPKKRDLERVSMDRKIVEYLRDEKSATAIAKLTGKGKGYVIKVRDQALDTGYIEIVDAVRKTFRASAKELPPYPEALFPLRDGRSEKVFETDLVLESSKTWIQERIELGWSPQTVFEELQAPIPRSNFYRYLQRQHMQAKINSRNIMELIHAPGECLQVDWGKLFDVIDPATKKKKAVWIFIGILGHSRFEMARVVECLDYESTIQLLISMFEEMGGIPRKVTSDNPKVFVRTASEYEPILNPAFERFASHYGFTIEALPPASPEKKGKVERMVPVKRRLFESYDLENYTLESAQSHLDRKLGITNERRHGTHLQKPIEVFINDEVDQLKPLPSLRYEHEAIVHSNIRADGYVRFMNKYYRVDKRLKGESALVIGGREQVSIYAKGRLLEVYQRIQDKFESKACKDHYKEPWEKTLQDHGHYLKRALEMGANVERFINIVLARGEGFVDTRVVWGVMTLNKTYANADIDKACLSALELSQVNLQTVRQLLKIMSNPQQKEIKNEEPLAVQTKGGKFARSMSEYKNYLRLVPNQSDQP